MIKCVAIDDEKKALEVISLYIGRIDQLELVATFIDPIKASSFLQTTPVDLLFLDINMQGLNGFELLETLTQKPKVIFTSAYSEYAVNSYQVDALDYLVKPIEFTRFLKAVNKLKSEISIPKEVSADNVDEIISIKSGTAIHRVKLNDIWFVEADGNYCKYVTKSEVILVLGTLKETMSKLDDTFMQVHRSFVVAIRHIEKVEVHQLHIHGKTIPISSSYRKVVLNELS
ncbi:DNA-binding response regulator [Marivirga tractuosa]|uniref:Two component transcriptional regulator, LytTR family n=1 Tax=Marivirga tractuosa (strain ATCC 23168 / DSM 4126 / NBRC 15989 / NCIMB 1408 / VKM B-1430 / H-43) TaxID=643867 RepID=E4TUZ3_MARTH|nr:LytTR family DNA-binding domain-containing protein [Marivirga tractuosa]ADR21098.1 two component transcriptional regulator, LytTR family [Marivirga tractuosa DSM 4126]BDD14447.1 DNA-binding response regulator [Marivirga tractuosa]